MERNGSTTAQLVILIGYGKRWELQKTARDAYWLWKELGAPKHSSLCLLAMERDGSSTGQFVMLIGYGERWELHSTVRDSYWLWREM
ncbi:hypothetical protein LSAT2_010213, partial [Lamellibrachia satsuma]